jgi:hypothetical protein
MHDRQKRISLLARHNVGTMQKSDFIQSLSIAFGRPLDEDALIDLETTDQLTVLVKSAYNSAKRDSEPGFVRYFSRTQEEKVFALISCLGTKVRDGSVFLLFRQSRLCGAVSVEVGAALARACSLLAIDGDGITVIGESQKDGLLLDFSPDDSDNCYELVVWGSLWPVLFLACVPN